MKHLEPTHLHSDHLPNVDNDRMRYATSLQLAYKIILPSTTGGRAD